MSSSKSETDTVSSVASDSTTEIPSRSRSVSRGSEASRRLYTRSDESATYAISKLIDSSFQQIMGGTKIRSEGMVDALSPDTAIKPVAQPDNATLRTRWQFEALVADLARYFDTMSLRDDITKPSSSAGRLVELVLRSVPAQTSEPRIEVDDSCGEVILQWSDPGRGFLSTIIRDNGKLKIVAKRHDTKERLRAIPNKVGEEALARILSNPNFDDILEGRSAGRETGKVEVRS